MSLTSARSGISAIGLGVVATSAAAAQRNRGLELVVDAGLSVFTR